MTFGEIGIVPPSVLAHINVINYYIRMVNTKGPTNKFATNIFNELSHLDSLGFSNWITKAKNLAKQYFIDLDDPNTLELNKYQVKKAVLSIYNEKWLNQINDPDL